MHAHTRGWGGDGDECGVFVYDHWLFHIRSTFCCQSCTVESERGEVRGEEVSWMRYAHTTYTRARRGSKADAHAYARDRITHITLAHTDADTGCKWIAGKLDRRKSNQSRCRRIVQQIDTHRITPSSNHSHTPADTHTHNTQFINTHTRRRRHTKDPRSRTKQCRWHKHTHTHKASTHPPRRSPSPLPPAPAADASSRSTSTVV